MGHDVSESAGVCEVVVRVLGMTLVVFLFLLFWPVIMAEVYSGRRLKR